MNIYLLRHGESMANLKKCFAGHYDIDLSEVGYQQAELASEYITENLKIDKIYASDLLRAYNTAVPTAKKLGLEIVKESMFREIYAGDWEGVAFDTLREKYIESYSVWMKNIGMSRCDNGESVEELGLRILKRLREVAEENKDKNILIATHATPIRVTSCLLEGRPLSEMKDIPWVGNASITTLSNENGKLKLVEYGNDSHLGSMVTRLAGNV